MNATKTERTVKHFFSGEHTTTYSKATGMLPNRTCCHKHKTQEAAHKCAIKNQRFTWVEYAEMSDGVVEVANNLILFGM